LTAIVHLAHPVSSQCLDCIPWQRPRLARLAAVPDHAGSIPEEHPMQSVHPLVEKKRDHIEHGLSAMGERVLVALRQAIDCLRGQDSDLAQTIISGDDAIDTDRRALEQECLVVLAAHKPAGRDLRAVGATLELATELERIADYAVDAARNVAEMGEARFPAVPLALVAQMAEEATAMVAEALASYGHEGDAVRARAAAAGNRAVVAHAREAVDAVIKAMQADPTSARAGVLLLWAVRDFQRAAGRATNIAERVVYIATGETIDLN
jgi:phosphate transport system protein